MAWASLSRNQTGERDPQHPERPNRKQHSIGPKPILTQDRNHQRQRGTAQPTDRDPSRAGTTLIELAGDTSTNGRAVAQLRGDGKLTFHQLDSLAHADEPQAPPAKGILLVKANAVVTDSESNFRRCPSSFTVKCRTPLYFTAFCRASCKIRNRQSEISLGTLLGIPSSVKSISTFCCSDNSRQKLRPPP